MRKGTQQFGSRCATCSCYHKLCSTLLLLNLAHVSSSADSPTWPPDCSLDATMQHSPGKSTVRLLSLWLCRTPKTTIMDRTRAAIKRAEQTEKLAPAVARARLAALAKVPVTVNLQLPLEVSKCSL
jgi:hypothetical protein